MFQKGQFVQALSFLFFWGGGGLSFALNCKKRFRRGRSFSFELLQMVLCVCCKKCAEISYWTFCFVCLICLLMVWLCFPNLLAYGLVLFSKFACLWFCFVFQICLLMVLLCFPNLLRLRSQIWKRVTFAWIL